MSISGKVWGSTTKVIVTPTVEIHAIVINPHSQCSLHRHQYKWNAFLVWSGHLSIEVHKNDYPLVDVTTIGPGGVTTVKPGEDHRFISHDEVVLAWEVYYLEPLSEDIIRKDCGSVLAAVAGA